MKRRLFYSDNGTLSDLTVDLNNYHSGTSAFTLVADEDAFYIGARMPFNHLYFKLSGTDVNAETATMSIYYWDATDWREAVEVIDETSSGGVTLAQSGFVTWVPDRDYGWAREDTNYAGGSITGLSSIEVYDQYWLKITFSADLTADTTLSWLGQKFSNDDDLGSEYSDLVRSTVLTAFEAGKTTWEEQHIVSAELIIKKLISKGIILEREQILEREDFRLASVSKCAEIIYGGMGDAYKDDREKARKEFDSRFNDIIPRIDTNLNAREEPYERFTQGSLYR